MSNIDSYQKTIIFLRDELRQVFILNQTWSKINLYFQALMLVNAQKWTIMSLQKENEEFREESRKLKEENEEFREEARKLKEKNDIILYLKQITDIK